MPTLDDVVENLAESPEFAEHNAYDHVDSEHNATAQVDETHSGAARQDTENASESILADVKVAGPSRSERDNDVATVEVHGVDSEI